MMGDDRAVRAVWVAGRGGDDRPCASNSAYARRCRA